MEPSGQYKPIEILSYLGVTEPLPGDPIFPKEMDVKVGKVPPKPTTPIPPSKSPQSRVGLKSPSKPTSAAKASLRATAVAGSCALPQKNERQTPACALNRSKSAPRSQTSASRPKTQMSASKPKTPTSSKPKTPMSRSRPTTSGTSLSGSAMSVRPRGASISKPVARPNIAKPVGKAAKPVGKANVAKPVVRPNIARPVSRPACPNNP